MKPLCKRITMAAAVTAALSTFDARGQTSNLAGVNVTYQGALYQNGAPVNGTCDFQLTLYNDASAGSITDGPRTFTAQTVTKGIFTVKPAYTATAFPGSQRFLEISVRCPAGSGSYQKLLPRQEITPAPYALALAGLKTELVAGDSGVANVLGGSLLNTTAEPGIGATVFGGGDGSQALPANHVWDGLGVVGGGAGNEAGDNDGNAYNQLHATVSGGRFNKAKALGSMVPGGEYNEARGTHSFAAGMGAIAYNNGSFVWADEGIDFFGSSAANQFLVRAAGGMGVGTNAPENQLHVVKSINAAATIGNHVMQVENSSTGDTGDVLALKIAYTGSPLAGNNFITFFKGDETSAGSIEGNGSGGVVLAGPGNDYAEWLPKLDPREDLRPGDVVGVFEGKVSRRTEGASQLMAVSTGSIVAGNDPGEEGRSRHALVAFIGQVAMRVKGRVNDGDLLVPSGKGDGLAVAIAAGSASPAALDKIVGRAWSSKPTQGEGTVRAVVGLPNDGAVVRRLAAVMAEYEAELAALRKEVRRHSSAVTARRAAATR